MIPMDSHDRKKIPPLVPAALILLSFAGAWPENRALCDEFGPSVRPDAGKSVLLGLKISMAGKKDHRVSYFKSILRQRKTARRSTALPGNAEIRDRRSRPDGVRKPSE